VVAAPQRDGARLSRATRCGPSWRATHRARPRRRATTVSSRILLRMRRPETSDSGSARVRASAN
jgi:hypothetical protein